MINTIEEFRELDQNYLSPASMAIGKMLQKYLEVPFRRLVVAPITEAEWIERASKIHSDGSLVNRHPLIDHDMIRCQIFVDQAKQEKEMVKDVLKWMKTIGGKTKKNIKLTMFIPSDCLTQSMAEREIKPEFFELKIKCG